MAGLLGPARHVAGAGFLLALACHLATYLPIDPERYQPLVFGSFPIAIPLVLIVVHAQNQRRIKIDHLVRFLTLRERIVGAALLAYLVIDFILMVTQVPGQPEVRGPNFYLDNHGSLSRISHADYLLAVAHVNRLFSGHEMAFYALVVGLATLIRRRDAAGSENG